MAPLAPSAPGAPRTFPNDPNPPPVAPEPATLNTSTGPTTSAGSGALPPAATPGQQNQPAPSDRSYSVIERPGGARDVFMSDAHGDQKLGSVDAPDADKVLHAVGNYDKDTKTWTNIPEDVVKSLTTGRLGFPERIINAWNGGEQQVVTNLLGAQVMHGEITGDQFREKAAPDLVKARLDAAPGLAWHGLGPTVADAIKHPVDLMEGAAVDATAALPTLADVLIKGTLVGAIGGFGVGELGAGLAASEVTGPLAPEVATAYVAGSMAFGAQVGTFKRSMDLFGGQFAADMLQKGYDDKAVQRYAPIVGAMDAALTLAQFDLMAPANKVAVLKKVLNSGPVKRVMASWVAKYAGKAVGFGALGTAQEAVNIFAGNLVALAEDKPQLLTAGPEARKRLLDTAIKMTLVGGVLGPATEGVAKVAGRTWEAVKWESPTTKPASESPAPAPGSASAKESPSPEPRGSGGGSGPKSGPVGGPAEKEASADSVTGKVPLSKDDLAAIRAVLPKEADVSDPATLAAGKEKLAADMVEQFENAKNYKQDYFDKMTPQAAQRMVESIDRAKEIYRKMTGQEPPDAEGLDAAQDRFREKAATETPAEKENARRASNYEAEKEAAKRTGAPPPEPPTAVGPQWKPETAGVAEPKVDYAGKDNPFRVAFKTDDATTAADIRRQFTEQRNKEIVAVNQRAEAFERAVPDEMQRKGAFWYKEAKGDEAVIKDALADPDLKHIHPELRAALNLTPETKAELAKLDAEYARIADVSEANGTIRSVRENYQNRIYEPDKPKDHVKSELRSGVRPSTRHAKQRVFETAYDAARYGKLFRTTDVAKTYGMYGAEMARVNASKAMADAMADAGLGAWKKEVPDGWAKVGNLKKSVPIKDAQGEAVIGEDGNQIVSTSYFCAPEGIAKGLEAIADPNFTKQIPVLREIQHIQGRAKQGFLSFSLFHHFSMVMQTVYQRDFSTLLKMANMDKWLSHPDFLELEQHAAGRGLITSAVEPNQDILGNLVENTDLVSKAERLPGVKQLIAQSDRNSKFLFGKMQRLMKVYNFSHMAAEWSADHPAATDAQVEAAERSIADHVNSVYGGLNWEALGMTKSNLSLLRLGILAPDWTGSNALLLKDVFDAKDLKGTMARKHVVSALAIGMLGTEAVNKMLTGHFTDENKPGHWLEVEVAPDVYVSLLRGGIGDIAKLGSMVSESGLGGVTRFLQGKLAPFARVVTGLLANTEYTGKPVVSRGAGPVAGTYDVLKYLLANLTPIPLGISNLMAYFKTEEEKTLAGALAVGSGVGRYSKGKARLPSDGRRQLFE